MRRTLQHHPGAWQALFQGCWISRRPGLHPSGNLEIKMDGKPAICLPGKQDGRKDIQVSGRLDSQASVHLEIHSQRINPLGTSGEESVTSVLRGDTISPRKKHAGHEARVTFS
jgi:hypothetical protein